MFLIFIYEYNNYLIDVLVHNHSVQENMIFSLYLVLRDFYYSKTEISRY